LLLAAPFLAPGEAHAAEHSRPHDSGSVGREASPRGSAPSAPSSSAGSAPRTAEPRSGGSGGSGGDRPSRQPPTRDTRGHDDHGGSWHGGGGGYYGHGGYYGGYYGHGGYYGRYYYDPFWSWGWSPFWWGAYFGYDYGQPYYYPGDRRYGRDSYMGALDLDVSPGRTQVYIDGRYAGIVDSYDGFPQYLWLDRGTYDVVFYLDGYRTIARQITVRPGTVIDIDDSMERGESVRPEDLATKTHERRDTRIRDEEERREDIARHGDDNWRDRVQRRHDSDMDDDSRHGSNRDYDRDDDDDDEDEDGRAADQPRNGAAQLHLDVTPSDASIYLDGHFVGTGRDVSRNALRLTPGEHHLSIVRPGRKPEERDITVEQGGDVSLDIDLAPYE
jgi:hypothetical protein